MTKKNTYITSVLRY